MSLTKEVQQALEKIGSVSMTTLDQKTSDQKTSDQKTSDQKTSDQKTSDQVIMHSRIISICGSDDQGIYFLTMNVKPFYRQLKKNPQVSLCGIYPSGRKTGKNSVGQPTWPPGFTLRITGHAREIQEDEVQKKAAAGSEIHQYFLEDAARYPAIRFFCIHRGKGEIFDFDFEQENRDHKLLRTRFAFGKETFNKAGARINPDTCIACGNCFEVCSFKAVVPGEPYAVDGSRCDECGSCFQACPNDAIELSQTI